MPVINGRFYINPAHGRALERARTAEAAGRRTSQHGNLFYYWGPSEPGGVAHGPDLGNNEFEASRAEWNEPGQSENGRWVTINHRHILIRGKGRTRTASDETAKLNKIYNEFSGLRPKEGVTTADDLNRARRNASHVYDNVHGKHFQGSPKLGPADARDVQIPGTPAAQGHQATKDAIAAAAQEPDTTQEANHVYIYDPAGIHSGRVHPPPWVTQGQTTTIAGPFTNKSGGGDLPRGDEVFIITVNDRNMSHPDR
jgi:hypothetical protein